MKTIYFIFSVFILSTFLSATIINVPANQPTIQAGINVSSNTDTVLVQPGTYIENINYNGKLITVASLFLTTQDTTYISQTIIDGNQDGRVVTFENGEDETAILTGFTVTNGDEEEGGGIYCDNSSPSLDNLIITDNSAGLGGGIYCLASSPSLANVTITGNSATIGGGICCEYNFSPPNFDPIDRCNIFLNFAGLGCDLYAYNTINVIVDTFTVLQPDDYFAYPIDNFTFDILNAKVEQVDQDLYVSPDGSDENSGLTVNDPLLTISYALTKILADSTNTLIIHISNGTYSPSGIGEIFPLNCRSYVSLLGEDEASTILDGEGLSGILFCENDNNFSIENVTIQNGNADFGGGIYCADSSPSLMNVNITGDSATWGGGILCVMSSPILQNVTITDNTAYTGGGIYCEYYSNPILQNVTIKGNTAEDVGGGIYCEYSSPNLQNVTITGNTADNGGGIFCWGNSNPSLINSILWNDSPEEIYIYFNSVTATYSDIQGGWAGEGNIDADPLFVGIGVYPYSLLEDSPCIDAGNPDPIYYDPEDPLNPGYALWPAMGTIINDMGAYGGPLTIGWPPVGLDDNVIVQISEVFLHQNYPNPFNPTTTINYSLKENSKVSLKIYNIKGQKVKTLVNEILPEGEHSIIWNGSDSNDKRVGSGIYFYKLKAGDHQKVKKMVLMK